MKKSIALIFRYADWVDYLLMFLGTVGAVGDGMSTNVLLVFASRLMNSLGYSKNPQNHGNFMNEVEKVSIQHCLSLALSLSALESFFFRFLMWFLLVFFPV